MITAGAAAVGAPGVVQVTAAGLVSFIESTPGLQVLDVLLPDGGAGGSAVDFNTCFALAANCGNLRVSSRVAADADCVPDTGGKPGGIGWMQTPYEEIEVWRVRSELA